MGGDVPGPGSFDASAAYGSRHGGPHQDFPESDTGQCIEPRRKEAEETSDRGTTGTGKSGSENSRVDFLLTLARCIQGDTFSDLEDSDGKVVELCPGQVEVSQRAGSENADDARREEIQTLS